MVSSSRAPTFRGNVLRLTGGAAISQLVLIIAIPVLTRLYEPSEFGVFAVFAAWHTFLAAVFTLKYDLAIILPESDEAAAKLTWFTCLSALGLCCALLIALCVGTVLRPSQFPSYVLLLPFTILIASAYSCVGQWSARERSYVQLSRSQVINSVINSTLGISLGYFVADLDGALIIAFCGGLTCALTYMAVSRCGDGWTSMFRASLEARRGVLPVARQYSTFPFFVLPIALVQLLSSSALPFVLQPFFTLEEVGLFSVGARFLMIPAVLVGAAFAEAFRSEFVARQKSNPQSLVRFFGSAFAKLSAVGVPVFGALFMCGPGLFEFTLGFEYREAGALARYLCLGTLSYFLVQPFYYSLIAIGDERLGLSVQTFSAILPIVAIVIGGAYVKNLEWTLIAWSVASCLTSLCSIWIIYAAVKKRSHGFLLGDKRAASAGSEASK